MEEYSATNVLILVKQNILLFLRIFGKLCDTKNLTREREREKKRREKDRERDERKIEREHSIEYIT